LQFGSRIFKYNASYHRDYTFLALDLIHKLPISGSDHKNTIVIDMVEQNDANGNISNDNGVIEKHENLNEQELREKELEKKRKENKEKFKRELKRVITQHPFLAKFLCNSATRYS
jgi:hypothetical protein